MTNNKEITVRLKKYLKDKGYTNKVFAEILGVSQPTMAKYLNDINDIQKIFILLYTKANINLNWLVSGKGNPTIEDKSFYLDPEEDALSITIGRMFEIEVMRRNLNTFHSKLPKNMIKFLESVDPSGLHPIVSILENKGAKVLLES